MGGPTEAEDRRGHGGRERQKTKRDKRSCLHFARAQTPVVQIMRHPEDALFCISDILSLSYFPISAIS